MTTVEKRKVLEAVDLCVRCDLLTDMEAERIMMMCSSAIGRAVAAANGEGTEDDG